MTQCLAGQFCPNASMALYAECTPGSYCMTVGLSVVTGECLQGYYCPSGSSSKTQHICPIGSYCPTNSPAALACPTGSNYRCPFAGMAAPCVPFSNTTFVAWDTASSTYSYC